MPEIFLKLYLMSAAFLCTETLILILSFARVVASPHHTISVRSITPIFTLSSVSGENLDLLKVFFNILPPLSNSKEQEELMQQLTEFQVLTHMMRLAPPKFYKRNRHKLKQS